MGAADRLSNNPIGQCPETRYICSAQITPLPRTLLDVSPRFSPDSVDNQQQSHAMTEAHPRKQRREARGSVDNGWLSTCGTVTINQGHRYWGRTRGFQFSERAMVAGE